MPWPRGEKRFTQPSGWHEAEPNLSPQLPRPLAEGGNTGSVWGEGGGTQRRFSPSQQLGTLEGITLPLALSLPRLPPTASFLVQRINGQHNAGASVGERGGGSGEETADGNSLLIHSNERVRGEIRRDRE